MRFHLTFLLVAAATTIGVVSAVRRGISPVIRRPSTPSNKRKAPVMHHYLWGLSGPLYLPPEEDEVDAKTKKVKHVKRSTFRDGTAPCMRVV